MRNLLTALTLFSITLIIFLCTVSFQASAAGFDGEAPIVCAFARSLECDNESGCNNTTLEALNLPVFFELDLGNNTVTGIGPATESGAHRYTKIKNIQRMDGKIILQGVDLRGWSAVINEKTGKMTVTLSGDNEAFVLFGACTTL